MLLKIKKYERQRIWNINGRTDYFNCKIIVGFGILSVIIALINHYLF